MTKKERDSFGWGTILGGLIVLAFIFIVREFYCIYHPTERYAPDYLLNSPEFTIDTTTTIRGNDTTYMYRFVEVKKEKY